MDNRVIKFRVWYDGRMIKESFCEYLSGYGCMFNQFTKPDAIMQFTGLYDKNGKEIYEGDIVIHINTGGEHEQVYWNKEDACFACKGGEHESWLDPGYEVIGNIYENPELLESFV